MDPGAVIKAALGSRSSGLEPSPDSKHKQLSSSELQPASISRVICNRIVHIRNIKGTHICDPHDGGPPLGGECWYNCTLEDIAREEKKRLLPEGTRTNSSVV
ncbi:hypothetical protein PVAP13_3NG167502 [Panicum virgatum]|uniref:Uncharacterized protein n=1 Tax=Panicum virgatum TaxID=38727 RepID=A0A8T0UD49_PANVG|nr:hypothetical protein PVAP13_3NG167502 [Panicum virgatum]